MPFTRSRTFTNPYRKGSAFRPTHAQLIHRIEVYIEDHPETTWDDAYAIILKAQRDWIEEHYSST